MDLQAVFTKRLALPPPGQPLDSKAIPTHGGVYAFADEHGGVIQTISAQNLRRSVTFRLEPQDETKHRRRADLRAVARTLWWIPTYSTFESSLVYLEVIRRLVPKDYHKQLGFGPVWFARMNLDDRLPRWLPDKHAFKCPGGEIGPFERRAGCTRFIEALEDLFDLCRYHDILEQTPDGQACAYFEMGKCPAPCNGTISLDQYHQMLAASQRFSRGDYRARFDELEVEMKRAADELQYERAARIRESLDRARRAVERSGLFSQTPEEFRFLIVQRAERRNRVKPFFCDRGVITPGESVSLKSLDSAAAEWTRRMEREVETPLNNIHQSECIWLVCHFLFKGERAPGVFLPARDLTTPDKLSRCIVKRFTEAKSIERNASTTSETGIAETK